MAVSIPLPLLASAKSKEDRAQLANRFLAARPQLQIYRNHLITLLETLDYQAESPDNFAQPEVTHRLAYQAGQRKALNSMLDLLEWVTKQQGPSLDHE